MPPSQLKRLKASLREQGIFGPQHSKKQKKKNAQNGPNQERRVRRTTALTEIREHFNPFENKAAARGPKFEVTSSKTLGGRVTKSIKSRPGVAKKIGEENRRRTLLVEMQRRKKVGGIMDRRFGENDPSMAPEDKMLERFTQEKQRRHKNISAFDLQDEDTTDGLTHMGQSLSLDGPVITDDFDEEGLESSEPEDEPPDLEERQALKRRLEFFNEDDKEGRDATEPGRKKTKKEVMDELIAKSKLHKYERQAAKDEDEDLREELDKELPNIHEILREAAPKSTNVSNTDLLGMNPDRAALLNEADKAKLEKEYDMRLKQMIQDKRSKPTERTKTEEEVVEEESRKLQELERKRLLRMQGTADASDDGDEVPDDIEEEAAEEDFGFGSGIKARQAREEMGVEDEDEFLIEDDVASDISSVSTDEEDSDNNQQEAEEDDFLAGLLTEEESKRPEFLTDANASLEEQELSVRNEIRKDLAYTFACPQSHEELIVVTKDIALGDLPIVIQRIRALYHPKLKSENKSKLASFACSLVDHIFYLANQSKGHDFNVLETIIRHIHSLAKTFSIEIANAFRRHLQDLYEARPLSPIAGDLILLTAVGTIFPTSDHFHQVVTPAMLSIARYLGHNIPQKLSEFAMGAYLCTLCLEYQKLSKRYVPEMMNFVEYSLCVLAPKKLSIIPGNFPYHVPKKSVRVNSAQESARTLNFSDCIVHSLPEDEEDSLKVALLDTNLRLLDAAADTWLGKPAFTELFEPALKIVQHLESKSCRIKLPESSQKSAGNLSRKLQEHLSMAHLARRPLELHHHRPLAIKTFIPKFEESYDPDKHYDPNRERAEAAKLRAQHKKERKGAMRELRKDANFIARESLREKRERDAAHEKKMNRLVAEIQGEEGRESKAYAREKEWRKKGKK